MPLLNNIIRSTLHVSITVACVLHPEIIKFAYPQKLVTACVVLEGRKKGEGGGGRGLRMGGGWGRNVGRVE